MKTKRDISQPDRLYASLNRFIATTVLLSAEEEHALVCDGSPEARDRLISRKSRAREDAQAHDVKKNDTFVFSAHINGYAIRTVQLDE